MSYSITVAELGYTENFPADFSFDGLFLAGETMFNPFSVALLRKKGGNELREKDGAVGGKNILIDCGFNLRIPSKAEIYKLSGATNGHSTDEVLASVGVSAADIDSVIMTHLHWDHAGGVTCFPNATFYLQREELEGWETLTADPRNRALSMLSMDTNDLAAFRALEQENRLILLDGDVDNLFPGIDIRVSRFSHAFAVQMVLIKCDDGNSAGYNSCGDSNDSDSNNSSDNGNSSHSDNSSGGESNRSSGSDNSSDSGNTVYLHVGDVCNRPENLLGTEQCPFFLPNTKFAVGGAANAVRDYARILEWSGGDVNRVIMTHDGTRHLRYPEVKTDLGLSVYTIRE